MRGIKKLRAVLAMIVGAAMLLAGGCLALAGMLLSESKLGDANAVLSAGEVRSSQGRMSIICMGGVERAVEDGVNVAEVQENITGTAGLMIAGVPANKARGQWQAYSAEPPENPQTGTGVTTSALSAELKANSELGAPAFSGALSIARSQGNGAIMMGGNAHRAEAGDLRGLAYNSCSWPTNSAWLVGSASAVGSSNRLIVANPSLTSINVRVQAFSSIGEIPLGTSSVVLLPAHTVRSISLDGLVDEDERVAFYLAADSGQFTATIQATALDGFTPAGIEFLQAGRAGASVMIPGLFLPAGQVDLGGVAGAEQTGTSALVDPAVKASVRIVNPGSKMLTANVALIGGDGEVTELPGGSAVELAPGAVLDLSLDGVKPGDYTVHIAADGAVAGGAMLRYDAAESGADVAWLAARSAVTHGAAAAGIGSTRLILTPEIAGTSVRAGSATWIAYDADGKQLGSEKVQLDGTTGIDMPAGTTFVEVEAAAPVYGALLGRADLGNGTGVAWSPLTDGGAGSSATHILVAN